MKFALSLIFFMLFATSWGQCESFSLTLSNMDPSCYGFCDGSVTSVVSGANGMIYGEVTDSNGTVFLAGAMGTSPNDLCPGWYYVEVQDDSSCYALDSIYLSNPLQMQAQLTLTDPTHLDTCNGIAEVDTVLDYQGNYANINYFWNPGGPGGVGETIKNDLCNDFYSVTIYDEFGCSIIVDITSGSASIAGQLAVKSTSIYPNPARDYIHIANDHLIPSKIQIYSMTGQLIKTGIIESNKIDLSDIVPGQYILKISNNQSIYTSRIVKE
ncbi:MAG: T9SS type A sorting domain-containing protein [Crocinitomicaceae bacterium]